MRVSTASHPPPPPLPSLPPPPIHGLMLRNVQQHERVYVCLFAQHSCLPVRRSQEWFLIALIQAEAHLHGNKSRTEACLRPHSDCRTRMAFMVPAMVVTQATVLCNTEPTLFECGPSRTACLPACLPCLPSCPHVRGTNTPNGKLHHLLVMITGNNKKKKKQKCTFAALHSQPPVFPKSLFLFSDRDDK